MTAKKSTTKKSASKTTAKKKSAKKAPAKKKVGAKKASAKKRAPSKKSASKAAPTKKASTKKASGGQEKQAATKTGASSIDVNLGHVFALRPRVSTTFRQEHFRSARQLLQDESYANLSEAARAVAERALELTHEGASRTGTRRGR